MNTFRFSTANMSSLPLTDSIRAAQVSWRCVWHIGWEQLLRLCRVLEFKLHSFIHLLPLNSWARSWGLLDSIPFDIEWKQGTTWTSRQVITWLTQTDEQPLHTSNHHPLLSTTFLFSLRCLVLFVTVVKSPLRVKTFQSTRQHVYYGQQWRHRVSDEKTLMRLS